MQTPDESNSPACRRSSLLFALPAAVIFAQAAPAGIGIVNANQHRTVEAANCPPTPSQCPQSTTLPLDDLGDYYLIGANSFHVKDEEGCQFAQARCFYDDRNKAKILSSDPPWSPLGCGAALDPEVVQPWITATTNETQHPRGTIHFEHFDACLSYKAQRGEEIISDFDSFPNIADCHGFDPELFPNPEYEVSPQAMLIWIAQPARTSLSATRLLQNGWLHRTGPVLKWQAPDPDCSPSPCFVDEPKRLIGMGFMGALTAESHLVIPDYVRTLRNYNVNFTRIWSVEQWCGLAGGLLGLTPFAGQWGNDTYNLDGDKPAFYHRLRRFAQEAADRGIVLQLSLFDKHGLVCNSQAARWLDSPYRAARNNKAWLANTILNCTCGCGVSCHPLTEFIENAELGAIHKRYLRRVAEEVGGSRQRDVRDHQRGSRT